jgi:AcrR family transcriptional regulator
MADKKKYHHGNLAKVLVDAAAALVAERGAGAVSMREVAKRAKVSHAAPYHHFANKAEMLHAVALEGFRRMDAEMKAAVGASKKRAPYEQLSALGEAYIRFAARHPHYFKAMFNGAGPDASLPDPDQHGQKNFHVLVVMVQQCLGEQGKPSPRVLDHVLAAWAMVHGMASLWVDRGMRDTPFENKRIERLAKTISKTARSMFH